MASPSSPFSPSSPPSSLTDLGTPLLRSERRGPEPDSKSRGKVRGDSSTAEQIKAMFLRAIRSHNRTDPHCSYRPLSYSGPSKGSRGAPSVPAGRKTQAASANTQSKPANELLAYCVSQYPAPDLGDMADASRKIAIQCVLRHCAMNQELEKLMSEPLFHNLGLNFDYLTKAFPYFLFLFMDKHEFSGLPLERQLVVYKRVDCLLLDIFVKKFKVPSAEAALFVINFLSDYIRPQLCNWVSQNEETDGISKELLEQLQEGAKAAWMKKYKISSENSQEDWLSVMGCFKVFGAACGKYPTAAITTVRDAQELIDLYRIIRYLEDGRSMDTRSFKENAAALLYLLFKEAPKTLLCLPPDKQWGLLKQISEHFHGNPKYIFLDLIESFKLNSLREDFLKRLSEPSPGCLVQNPAGEGGQVAVTISAPTDGSRLLK